MEKNLPFQTIQPVPPQLECLADYGSTFVQAPLYQEKSDVTTLTFKLLAFQFLLDIRCSKWMHSFFCGCLSPKKVNFCNLFLLSPSIAKMLLTPRWVSRQKYVKQLFITISTTAEQPFLLIPIQQRRQPIFLSLHLWFELNYIAIYVPLQRPNCYIPLESACCLFVAYCHHFRNRKSYIGQWT